MDIKHRILSTILYADVFDYPLTLREILYWLPGTTSEYHVNPSVIQELIEKKVLEKKQGYFVLKGRSSLIALRKRREMASKKKMIRARAAAKILSRIPTVECVGVTGGVSMKNADSDDDIDICIITTDHTVWMTRLISTFLFDLKRLRRKPGDEYVKDKICLNMFWAKSSNPVFSRDWYTAHEIIQMRVLFDRRQAVQTFLHHNEWIRALFFTAWTERIHSPRKSTKKYSMNDHIYMFLCRVFDPLVYILQLIVMQRRRTTEIVNRECIRFHPKDSRPRVSREFRKRLKKYRVPLDKHYLHP